MLEDRGLANLFDSLDAIVWEADYSSGICRFVNQRAQMLGFSLSKWLETPHFWSTLALGESADDLQQELHRRLADNGTFRQRLRIRTTSEETILAHVSIVQADDPASGPLLRGLMIEIAEHADTPPYRQTIESARVEHLSMENDLRRALAERQFALHYQAKVDLHSGKITGVEALIRWQHPTLGLVSPAVFLPIAEQSGLIEGLGEWTLEKACQQLAAWQQLGLCELKMAVNLSAAQFNQPGLSELVVRLLRDSGVEAKRLVLEITEAYLIRDIEESIRAMQTLRDTGIDLALDDFGTGLSSLNYLSRFPINAVKIDRSFMTDVTSNPSTAALVRSIIGMARELRLKVVAEGVETEGQLQFLQRQHCDEAQGYLIGKPLPPEEFVEFYEQFSGLPPRLGSSELMERTLLLVDDEINILNALKRQLRSQGYRVLTATSAVEGFELLAKHPVGVILSDQRMTEMSGTEFLRRVKQLYPQIVRLVLSGYSDFKSITDAINQGAIYKFLSKPWDEELLHDTLREAFQHYELAQENVNLNQALRDASVELADRNCELPRQVLEHFPAATLGLDANGNIILANQQARALFPTIESAPLLGSTAISRLPAWVLADEQHAIEIDGKTFRHESFGFKLAEGEFTVIVLQAID